MAEESTNNGVNDTPKVTKEDVHKIDLELKQLELEARKLELAERTANLQDVKERLADRELKREEGRQRFVNKGAALAQTNSNEKSIQDRCNHKKGGQGRNGSIAQGDDFQYAVVKHKMLNGDLWVRCLRCAKTWKPPIRRSYKTEEAYIDAYAEYKAAVNFQTRNSDSASSQFRFSDGGQYFREVTESVTLR